LLGQMPAQDAAADVRIWADRAFHAKGAGTVVTGTLPAGTVGVGDRLSTGAGTVRVRGVQALGTQREQVSGVARVALNLVADDKVELDRDTVLVTPDAW